MDNNKKCPYCGSENTRYLVSRGEDLPAFRMCLDCNSVYVPKTGSEDKYAWDALIRRLAKVIMDTKKGNAEAARDLTCEDCEYSDSGAPWGLYCSKWKDYVIPAGFCYKGKKVL